MRSLTFAVLAIVLFGCSQRNASDQLSPQNVVGLAPGSKEPRFVFVALDGFEWNNEHRLWYNKSAKASVTLDHESRKSFQAVVDDFVADRMLAANLELISKDIRDMNGRPTLLVHGNRMNSKKPEQFCTVAYGTKTGCAQITAIYPSDMTEDLKGAIEESLLTSQYEAAD